MIYLLDTHIWIWSILEPDKLSQDVRQILEDQGNELWLSPISLWEFLVLVENDRVEIEASIDDWLEEAFTAAPIKEAPLTMEIARESRRIRLPHQDPADRFLAATAAVLDLTLITADARLGQSDEFSVLLN